MEKKKIKKFLVATNVVASQPPEHRPTGTPCARANFRSIEFSFFVVKSFLKIAHILKL